VAGTNGQDAGQSVLKTVTQAAAYVGLSERTIRRYIKAGKLGTLDVDGQVRIQPADLDTLAAVSGKAPAVTGENSRQVSGSVSDPLVDALHDIVRRQDAEITFLRATLERTMLMLPAPAHTAASTRRRRLWPWIIGAAVVVAGGLVVLAYYAGWLPG
jgi:excisionase family DNA binding protein